MPESDDDKIKKLERQVDVNKAKVLIDKAMLDNTVMKGFDPNMNESVKKVKNLLDEYNDRH